MSLLTFSSSSWATTLYSGIVDNGSTNGISLGAYTDAVSDATGAMHACYYDATNSDLKYATNTSGKWVSATVDSTGSVGTYCSIAVDSSDLTDIEAHISYFDNTNKDLKYATNASGTWVPYSVVSTNSVGMYSGIAVDDSGNVHISYYDVTNDDLAYTTGTASTATPWPTTTVDSSGTVGTYTAIAIDSSGYAHISYYDSSNSNLKYATNESGAWVTTIVDGSTTQTGMYPDIVVDSASQVHISYYNLTGGGELRYATDSDGDGVFETETVDSSGGVTGQYTSLGVDSTGVVHIAYYLYSTHDLRYAYGNAASWTKTSIDTSGDVGQYASLAVDGNDQVHISYYDLTNTDLKYATDSDRDGTFETETVDSSSNDVGKYSSIAMYDTVPVIVYYDATAQDLRMAVSP